MMAADSDLFKGRHFDQEVIVLCVRWYLSYKLSSRDLVNMMDERGIVLAHTTILRWVQRYVPEFEKRWGRYARSVGGSWRCDETYIKVKGRWTYLYRAVDKQGRTVDFLLSEWTCPQLWHKKLRLKIHGMENLSHGIIAPKVHEGVQDSHAAAVKCWCFNRSSGPIV